MKCIRCKKFTSNPKFCSSSCAAVFNNTSRLKYKCFNCYKPTYAKAKKFCTKICKKNYYLNGWLSGDIDGNAEYSYRKFVKDYLEERSKLKCEKCGFSQKRKNGSSILQVNHIDGNWRNSIPENLELICPNCHALTDNWGGYNRGKGRTWKANYNQYEKLRTSSDRG